jgi:hypothetical protein
VLEARAADSVLEEIEKTDSGVAEKSTKPAAWYASSPQDLRAATAWFKEVHRDYVQNHILREDWKSDFDAFFGPTFFQSLSEWNSVSVDDVLLAHMMRIKAKNYNLHLPPQLEESMKAPTVVVDPLQTQNLKEKLLEFQLHHLEALATMRQQRADTNTGGNRIADFSPRYYASAVRDLHRAVEWLFRLKELEGAA